jgi:hypothetical protein
VFHLLKRRTHQQQFQVQAGTAYQLNAKDFDAKKSSLIAKKVGDDLEVALEEGVIYFVIP